MKDRDTRVVYSKPVSELLKSFLGIREGETRARYSVSFSGYGSLNFGDEIPIRRGGCRDPV
jgi:hypothetical protein